MFDPDRLDAALDLDEETRTARDRLIHGLTEVNSAESLWNLYRNAAIPPGAPLVQLVETRRAILWAVAACAQVVGADPDRFATLVQDVQAQGEAELRRNLTRLGNGGGGGG